jgi:GWxTD domain-containing protein
MDFLNILIRPLCVAAAAAIGLFSWRRKTAAWEHAVWTVVLAAMLLQIPFSSLLPSVRIPVLKPTPAPERSAPLTLSFPAVPDAPARPVTPAARVGGLGRFPITLRGVGVAIYSAVTLYFLIRLIMGLIYVRRILRNARIAAGNTRVLESSDISVPMTTGFFRPTILLPSGWVKWEASKREAIVAHEEAHIERADWLIGLFARLNRCVFWFHPLAWWLERHLTLLAEEACDDSALRKTADPQSYAQALIEIALEGAQGRLCPTAVAMAADGNVSKRVARILETSRPLSRSLRPLALALLIAVVSPLLYVISAGEFVQRTQTKHIPSLIAPTSQVRYAPKLIAQVQRQRVAPASAPATLLEELVYIMSDSEWMQYLSLRTAAEQDRFLQQFWLRRDPTPGTLRNEFQEEHVRRLGYANGAFGSPGFPGWRSARGMIYIRFGPPDSNESHPSPAEQIADRVWVDRQETWRYRYIEGVGPDVAFHFQRFVSDPEGSGPKSSVEIVADGGLIYRTELTPGRLADAVSITSQDLQSKAVMSPTMREPDSLSVWIPGSQVRKLFVSGVTYLASPVAASDLAAGVNNRGDAMATPIGFIVNYEQPPAIPAFPRN